MYDSDIKLDSKFLSKFEEIMKNSKTLKLFIHNISQFRATYRKEKSSLKKRGEAHLKSTDSQEPLTDVEINERGTPAEEPMEETELSTEETESTTKKTESITEETESTMEEIETTTEEAESTTEETESTTEETKSTTEETSAPEIGQYWEMSYGCTSLYAFVFEKESYMVQYFEPSTATAH